MGADNTQVRARIILFEAVAQDMIDALNENNMKDWTGTDVEIVTETAKQAAFNSAAAVPNVTTGTVTGAASATRVNTYLAELKKLEPLYREIIIALNNKDWSRVDALEELSVTYNSVRLQVDIDRTAITSNTVTTTGSSASSLNAALIECRNMIFQIETAFNFRRDKRYAAAEVEIKKAQASLTAFTAANLNIINAT